MRNACKNGRSERAPDKESRARRRKGPKSLGKVRAAAGAPSADTSTEEPGAELGNEGRIGAALTGLLARRNERDAKGRYVRENTGHLHTLEHSTQLWSALEPLKREMVARVRVQL